MRKAKKKLTRELAAQRRRERYGPAGRPAPVTVYRIEDEDFTPGEAEEFDRAVARD